MSDRPTCDTPGCGKPIPKKVAMTDPVAQAALCQNRCERRERVLHAWCALGAEIHEGGLHGTHLDRIAKLLRDSQDSKEDGASMTKRRANKCPYCGASPGVACRDRDGYNISSVHRGRTRV